MQDLQSRFLFLLPDLISSCVFLAEDGTSKWPTSCSNGTRTYMDTATEHRAGSQKAIRPSPQPRHRAIWWLIAILATIIVAGIVTVWLASPMLSRKMHERVVNALQERFDSDLSMKSLTVRLFPSMTIVGEEVVLRRRGHTDLPPLITLSKFSARASLWGFFRKPTRISSVHLEGLKIEVPPRRRHKGEKRSADDDPVYESASEDDPAEDGPAEERKKPEFVIDEIVADGTVLRTLPRKSWKRPLEYEIQKLRLFRAGSSESMEFKAVLRNAKPPGDIQSHGRFGPWNREEPGDTPVSGTYDFRNADLSVFQGISGILSSKGSYRGVLQRLEVEGDTDTPDFTLKVSKNPVHLTTHFQAIVDGTNGDTLLQPVVARFGKSTVTARGGVVGTRGVKGRTISLDVTVRNARLEDVLRLGVRSKQPPITGAISFHSRLVIPPGDIDVSQKLKLDGAFELESARFTKTNVQDRINALSKLGKGNTSSSDAGSVASDFEGSFHLDRGVMTFPELSFRVPGVRVSLKGTYGLEDNALDFRGKARMEAKLSEMTTGFKSVLLKAIDPFFKKKGAGAEIPIKIQGTHDQPAIGLNLFRKGK
jgi:hypothetical protein